MPDPDAPSGSIESAQDLPAREHLKRLLTAQRTAFARHPPGQADRLAALRSLERALVARQRGIAAAISHDFGGRAVEETIALELFPLLNEIRYARRHLKRWMAARSAPVQWPFWPGKAAVVYQPRGVVGIVSAWNYPLFLTIGPLVGVLAAGNHALVKPSELAPATAELIDSILSGLYPAEYVKVVSGGPETAAALTRLPLDHLVFTGSSRLGKVVMQAAGENLVPVTLELGGKSPAIVHRSYPAERAAARILTGKLYTAGQTCVAPDYVLVPQEHRETFVAAARALIRRMYPALVNNADYTRIINARHYRRLAALVDDARRLGAGIVQVSAPADACDEANRVFPPTLVTNVHDGMALMHEEIFGPVLPIVEYRRLEDAIAYVNARPRPLALYYFDDNRKRVDAVVSAVPSGGVTVNDCLLHVGQAALPFGGLGASGMGCYHGFDGFQTFSHKKGVFLQGRLAPLGLLRPPYGAVARRILRFLVRGGDAAA